MSRYSGKCDFGDTYEILGDRIKNAKVFIGDNIIPLKMESYKDYLPYFPFLVGLMASSDDSTTIFLSSRSYVDNEEEDMISARLNWTKKKYRSLKKKNCEITVDDLLFGFSDDVDRELAKLVIDSNGKCDVPKNIHLPMAEYYRKELYDDMLKEGWDEDKTYKWVYGFDRWLDRLKEERVENAK